MLVRRETIEKVGLLDEAFFMYAEDVDWCYRMKQAGWKVVYFPTAKIVHHIGQSTRKVPFKMTYERHRSMWRFYRKHYSRGIALIDVATMLGIAGRCLIMMLRNLLKTITRGERRS
jgi:GT2 family glycosyltransferase